MGYFRLILEKMRKITEEMNVEVAKIRTVLIKLILYLMILDDGYVV